MSLLVLLVELKKFINFLFRAKMKLSKQQLDKIEDVFTRAEKFVSKPTRTPIFDIGYIKIKDKIVLGFHLECYTKHEKTPKHADIQFWIGAVNDFKKTTTDLFIEEFPYDKNNGLEIEKLKVSEIGKHKLDLYQMISNNIV